MHAANTSEVIIEAFLFHEYSGAAADEAFGGGLLGFIQTTGDFIAAPELVAERAAVGTVKTIDAILSDETSALEYLERVGQSAEDFANADIRDQATSVGNGVGNAALLAAEVVSGTRVARLGGRTLDGDAPDGPDADPNNPPNGSANALGTDADIGTKNNATTIDGTTCVYTCVVDGTTRYVGITDDVVRRGKEHLRDKNIDIEEIAGLSNLSRSEAKAVEQVLIEFYGLGENGGTLLNKINSVSRIAKPTEYEAALKRGAELLKKVKYPGFK